ncbi:helix-turn-helix domain-containing protein [Candidatus Frankia alpina]|uniref:helix-turn-helix domain-containing protein n=1 Tax=Candidatus Frankia alpina TaxID=2699483 RepID=UPI0013CF7C06|nr:helix-turn-helix domain-containing protein [Candidatus Frankia alpina]
MAGSSRVQAAFAHLFKEMRERSGLSYRDLERPTLASRGWINNVASGARWPDRSWASRADDALNSGGLLLAAWDRANIEREVEKRTRSLLLVSVKDSGDILAATNPDAVDVDGLGERVASLGVAYLSSPATPMLSQGLQLRQEAIRRIKEGAARPHEFKDLYLAAGRASGVLSYAALDLGEPDAATTHARTAWRLADLADDDEQRAWVRGTESLIARFRKDYALATSLITDGLKYAGPGTSVVRLLCGAAQCAANSGDSEMAQHLLGRALDARDDATPDTVNGLFSFSYAKQLYYAGSSLIWLPDEPALRKAEQDSGRAIELWEQEGEQFRSFDDEALAHVYMATARLKLGEIEGAMDAVRPIIELPNDRQISWIRKRVGELSLLLDDERFKHSTVAADAREELRGAG